MSRYARKTTVSVEHSQQQIKRSLMRYGADKFGVMESADSAMVAFQVHDLVINIEITLPTIDEFKETETGRERSENAAMQERNQAVRQRWRALLLVITAKLEAVESGISTLEREFMPFVVMPDGRVLADHIGPVLKQLVRRGDGKAALPDVRKILALPGCA